MLILGQRRKICIWKIFNVRLNVQLYTVQQQALFKKKNCDSCNVDTLTIFVIPVAFIIIAMVIIFLKCLFVLRTNPLIAFYIHFIYTIYILHVSFRGFTGATEIKWFDIKGQYYLCFTIFGSTDAFVGVCSSESDNWLLYLQIQSHWSNNVLYNNSLLLFLTIFFEIFLLDRHTGIAEAGTAPLEAGGTLQPLQPSATCLSL